jgi:mannose-6-phosphate isomerase
VNRLDKEGAMTCGGKDYSITQGDEIFFSAAVESITFINRLIIVST